MSQIYKYYLSGYTFETNVFFPELISSNEESKGSITVNYKINELIPLEATQKKVYQNEELNLACIVSKQLGFIAIWNNKDIEYTPSSSHPKDDAYLRMILLGSISMILANCLGNISLHAASVIINDKAILFCAKSGRGKSSLAAYFYSKGYTVLADDVTNIYVNDSKEIIALPSVPRIKLSEEALNKIDQTKVGLDRIPAYVTKYSLPTKDINQKSEYPIAAIYFPEFKEVENEIIEIKGRAKLKEISKHIYRPQLGATLPLFKHKPIVLFQLVSHTNMFHFYRSNNQINMKDSLNYIEHQLNNQY